MGKKVSVKGDVAIRSDDELKDALEELEGITLQIKPLEARQVILKKAATEYAVKNRVEVVQLDESYYRKIVRTNRFWNEDKAKKILKKVKVKLNSGKTTDLWKYCTTRRLDPDKLAEAVAMGHISEKKLDAAYESTTQAPFLQRYTGEAD